MIFNLICSKKVYFPKSSPRAQQGSSIEPAKNNSPIEAAMSGPVGEKAQGVMVLSLGEVGLRAFSVEIGGEGRGGGAVVVLGAS